MSITKNFCVADAECAAASVPIKGEFTKIFLFALLSYHPEKHVEDKTELAVSLMNGKPCLLVNSDRTSFQKCLVALQKEYLEQVQ